MTPAIAILNQKGGVGKTTVTLGLASAAWAKGIKTLVVDLDAQANSTYALGIEPARSNFGTGDAMVSRSPGAAAEMIVPSGWGDEVWVLPANDDLTERETDVHRANAQLRLKNSLAGLEKRFDLILFDCAPSLGLNTINALAAANGALIVAEPTVFGVRGVTPVLDLIETVWSEYNRRLELTGVVLNRVPPISTDAQLRSMELSKLVGKKTVWAPPIPNRVIVNSAHGDRSPIHSMGRSAGELPEIFNAYLKKVMA